MFNVVNDDVVHTCTPIHWYLIIGGVEGTQNPKTFLIIDKQGGKGEVFGQFSYI